MNLFCSTPYTCMVPGKPNYMMLEKKLSKQCVFAMQLTKQLSHNWLSSNRPLKLIFHRKLRLRRVKFASPTQKNSLKSTWLTPGRMQKCRRKVYSTSLASGKFRVTSAGIGVWRWIENEADPIQDGGRRTQTTRIGVDYDD